MPKLSIYIPILFTLLLINSSLAAEKIFPGDHLQIEQPISYDEMTSLLTSAAKSEHISVSKAGQSIECRDLFLVHLSHGSTNSIKIFFFGQQHGNEPAGKDALLYLIKYISESPDLLPDEVDLWIMPMINPDGAEKDQRRNANGYDLNRDHLLLSQPETQILHRVFRKIMPHISVDCHEFTRDSKDYKEKNWTEWPQIMMDCANNPLFDSLLYQAGVDWCEQVTDYMNQKGHNYTRYYVGGLPPDEEQRHSTPEIDDARNGLGAYQGLSFIIESGILRKSKPPHSDLPDRVDAYMDLLGRFLSNISDKDKRMIEQVRKRKMPNIIPTNYFWAKIGNRTKNIKVIDLDTWKVLEILTPNFMDELVIKNSVSTPWAYAIGPELAKPFKELLTQHDIKIDILAKAENFLVQGAKLLRIEDQRDAIYNRYAGRLIVEYDTTIFKSFDKGSIIVKMDQSAALRAALILEPAKLYGLYSSEIFFKLIDDDQRIPVWRVIKNRTENDY